MSVGPGGDEAFAAALAGLPGMGPAHLVRILSEQAPRRAWQRVLSGEIRRPEGPSRQSQSALFGEAVAAGRGRQPRRPWDLVAREVDPRTWWEPFAARGVGVTWWGRPDMPASLSSGAQPPGVLFWKGDVGLLGAPCVAVVGTRNASPDGRSVAYELGRDLAAAGICVVSGLALGIDGAAHAGALSSCREGGVPGACGTVGVAASGVETPYPPRHRQLWREVARSGAVVSEVPPDRPAQGWRFPSRNRLIAALARIVVVVESHARGGALITAEAALERGGEVRVVPGPVHSPASAGSNQLLYDGAGPVRDARDVLDALGVILPTRPCGDQTSTSAPPGQRPRQDRGGPPGEQDAEATAAKLVLEALGWRPATTGQVMARSGLDAATVARVMDLLSGDGLVSREGSRWSRRRF